MDLLDKGFETIIELPRDLRNEEILGRRFYTDLKRRYHKIDTLGEPEDWSNYKIILDPYSISFETLPLLSTVRYRYNKITNTVSLQFETGILPLEVRTLTQHFFKEMELWQKKKKSKQ
jgi:hypothetical protein